MEKMLSGDSEFNEVFYTDATTPKDEIVGGLNNGWAVAMTLLGYERGEAAATMPIPRGGAEATVRTGNHPLPAYHFGIAHNALGY